MAINEPKLTPEELEQLLAHADKTRMFPNLPPDFEFETIELDGGVVTNFLDNLA